MGGVFLNRAYRSKYKSGRWDGQRILIRAGLRTSSAGTPDAAEKSMQRYNNFSQPTWHGTRETKMPEMKNMYKIPVLNLWIMKTPRSVLTIVIGHRHNTHVHQIENMLFVILKTTSRRQMFVHPNGYICVKTHKWKAQALDHNRRNSCFINL